MVAANAHYLLYVDIEPDSTYWHFRLESVAGSEAFDVSDIEGSMEADRLALLALVRGLEALDQPTRVTLITANAYLRRGLTVGLPQWRQDDWLWERFGSLVPVKNVDLWQRIDRALQFHTLDSRIWRLDRVEPTRDNHNADRKVPRPRFLDRNKSLQNEELETQEV